MKRSTPEDLNGFDRLYEDVGPYRSHFEWIRSQKALRSLPDSVVRALADYREGLAKGRLLQWLDPPSDARILDNGCGAGYFLFDIQDAHRERSPTLVGTELSRVGLRLLNERKHSEGRDRIFAVRADVRELPFASERFDAVLCSEVLDHTPEPAAVIREMARVLRPTGQLLMTVPNGKAERFWDRLRRSGRSLLREAEEPEPYYEQHLTLRDLRRWIREAGLVLRKEELNTAIPLGTLVRRFPRRFQLEAARALIRLEPFLRFERLSTNFVVWAEKKP